MNKVMNALNEVREKCLNGEQISGLKISTKHRAGVPNIMKYLCELGYVQKIKSGKYRWKVGEVIPVMAKAVSDLAKSKSTKVTTLDQMDAMLGKQSEYMAKVDIGEYVQKEINSEEFNKMCSRTDLECIEPTIVLSVSMYKDITDANSELKKRVEELEDKLSDLDHQLRMKENSLEEHRKSLAFYKQRLSDEQKRNESLQEKYYEKIAVKYSKFCIFGITVFKIERR
jgi:chromosome segregation ATPase